MSISQQDKDYIRSSFAQIVPVAESAAAQFYARLFEIAPEVRPLFHNTNLNTQGKKLMDMLAVVVHALDNVETLVKPLQALGKRHIGYGARLEHYAVVGEALLWMLQQQLGEAYTPEVAAAWTKAYTFIVQVATEGLYENA